MVFGLFKKPTPAQGANQSLVVPVTSQNQDGVTPQSGAGKINLSKGQAISLTKTPSLTAKCTWPPVTDYDVYAIVLYQDGHTETVSTFGTNDGDPYSLSTRDGAVHHQGDIRRSEDAMASEVVDVSMREDILAVMPVVYSAQSNGTGSFRRYRVGMEIDNGGGQSVVVDATNAHSSETIYTCVPGIIINAPDGLRVEAVEMYSTPGSENRPHLEKVPEGVRITMDAGPRNAFK